MEWLYKEILGFTEDEIAGVKDKLKADKRFAAELAAITTPDETGQNTVDPFDTSSYGLPGGQKLQGLSAPAENSPADGVFVPPSDDSQTLQFALGDKETPIKDNPQVAMDKRNSDRRRSDLEMQSDQPDFHKMLHPKKNKSLADVYDTEFLKNPLGEAIKRDLKIGITKDAYLSGEMRRLLENFDKATRALSNELTVDIHILKEEESLYGPSSDLDVELNKLLVEDQQSSGDQLDEIVLEIATPQEVSPQLTELAELGLDLKEPSDLEGN
jgi:hypothetical protein